MFKKINLKLLLAIVISLIDEAIVIIILFLVLSLFGVEMPIWFIILVLIFSVITYALYRALKKSPLLGFENMVGKNGLAISEIARDGTIKIGSELWAARADQGNIEKGEEVIVIGQTGLKLKVTRKDQQELNK